MWIPWLALLPWHLVAPRLHSKHEIEATYGVSGLNMVSYAYLEADTGHISLFRGRYIIY